MVMGRISGSVILTIEALEDTRDTNDMREGTRDTGDGEGGTKKSGKIPPRGNARDAG